MSQMTSQTRDAIDALSRAGFQRREYKVRVEIRRDRLGRVASYGNAIIHLRCSRQRAIDMTPMILRQGLGVVHYIMDGEIRFVEVTPDYGMEGRLHIINVD